MSDQQSDEITKAMNEQRALEQKYAMLVTRRGQLKSLSQKQELAETKNEIADVSKELRGQTRKLMRQLKDNPDVGGNQKLIKGYKSELSDQIEELMVEMAEQQSFNNFKTQVDKGLEKQGEFDKLKILDRDLNHEIKKINDDLKKKQDEFAKDAQEAQDETARLKKAVNETKTESELQRGYKKREIEGKLQCMKRLNSRKEYEIRN